MTNGRIIITLFILTMIMTLVLRIQGDQLVTPSASKGILSLEFSTSASQTSNIRNEWKGPIRQAFYLNIALDYFYLLFYGLFLFFTCTYLSWLKPGGRKIGLYAGIAGLAAAGFDAVEDLLMVISIIFGGNDIVSLTTAICASIKFLLLGIAVLYILISMIYYLAKRERK